MAETHANPKIQALIDKHGIERVRDAMAVSSGYLEPFPSIDTFLDDPRYLGGTEITVYPFWRRVLRKVYPTPYHSPYRVILLYLAIGSGKSNFAVICMLYDLARLLHLESMHGYHSLSKVKPIAFALMNRTLTLSATVLMDTFKGYLTQSPFFQEHAEKCTTKKHIFNDIELTQASRAGHVLGKDVVGAILSELAFYDSAAQAAEAYHNAETRIDSRFLSSKNKHGMWPGRLIVDTSPADENSFVNEDFVRDAKNSDDMLVITGSYWDVHGDRVDEKGNSVMNYSGKTFRVFYGDKERDPCILDSSNAHQYADTSNIIDVPEEHRSLFESDLVRNLADKAGIPAVGSSAFITSVATIANGLTLPQEIKETYTLAVDDDIPVIVPPTKRPLFIHLDLSLTGDRTGIAVSHIADTISADHDGMPVVDIVTPVAFAIKSKTQIPLAGIKRWVIKLSKTHTVKFCSADQYQSAMLLQELNQAGIKAGLCSVDISLEPYNTVKRLLIDNRLKVVNNSLLQTELKNLLLVRIGKTARSRWKVDHPEGKSKDIADAVAGSVFKCLELCGDDAISEARTSEFIAQLDGLIEDKLDVDELDSVFGDDDSW